MTLPYATALVTGASRGIGAAIARRLVAGGLIVHGVARSRGALDALAAELGAAFVPCPADVTDTAAILATLAGAEIDILVNNAGGLATVKPLIDQTLAETSEVIALNLTAPLHLIQALVPGMVARQRGHVFNLTSTAARSVFAGTTTYAAAKAGLDQACKVLRHDLAGSGVRITDLAPGRVQTDFYLESFKGDRAALEARMYSADRPLAPSDIAETIWAALSLPPHATLSEIVISPTDQAPGGHVYRRPSRS
ncbi:SDR family oxidoreductase [Salipiger sp.]|uniref:SDR family oxidoreductase n=1 Tax=Salipiger sp. TaxID=2078585 RepID=UPI003A969598